MNPDNKLGVEYPYDHEELAYAWESVEMPIDDIAKMHIELQCKLAEVQEQSDFRGQLLNAILGDKWNKITLYLARGIGKVLGKIQLCPICREYNQEGVRLPDNCVHCRK
jgi:hypothetical protein